MQFGEKQEDKAGLGRAGERGFDGRGRAARGSHNGIRDGHRLGVLSLVALVPFACNLTDLGRLRRRV